MLVACGLAAATAGCGEDQIGLPQPVPVPDPDRVRVSGAEQPEADIVVVGLPGAVDDQGTVEVSGGETPASGRSTAQGSFVLTLRAKLGATLQLRYEGSKPITLTVAAAPLVPVPEASVVQATTSTNKQQDPRFEFDLDTKLPARDFVVANLDSGLSLQLRSDGNGALVGEIGARSGETVQVFLDDAGVLAEVATLTVP